MSSTEKKPLEVRARPFELIGAFPGKRRETEKRRYRSEDCTPRGMPFAGYPQSVVNATHERNGYTVHAANQRFKVRDGRSTR